MWWECDKHLQVVDHVLTIGGVATVELAERHGTPLYVYDAERIISNYCRLEQAFTPTGRFETAIYYAVKANSQGEILRLLASLGAGADVASPFEIQAALLAGFPKEKVMFTGVNVSTEDLRFAVEREVMVNVDSFSQVKRLAKFGPRSVCIRWNPGMSASRLPCLSTGGYRIIGQSFRKLLLRFGDESPTKFGIPAEDVLRAFKEAIKLGLEPIGLHQHIGSDWPYEAMKTFIDSVRATVKKAEEIENNLGIRLKILDFGGGIGVPHSSGEKKIPLSNLFSQVFAILSDSKLTVDLMIIEPGNYLVSDAGVLLTRVTTVERKGDKEFVGVDSGLNVFNSPALYGIYHEVINCLKAGLKPMKKYTIAGNLCESGDLFAVDRELPPTEEGELLAILNAGAYGAVMSSNYNLRPRAAEVMIVDGSEKTLRRKDTFAEALEEHKLEEVR